MTSDMKTYYENKVRRYEYILEALDTKIHSELTDILSGDHLPLNMELEYVQLRIGELAETREIITSEIRYYQKCLTAPVEDEPEGEKKEAE